MTGKNIIIPEANRVEIVDRPVADPGPGEVRVKMVRSAVSSGTERANYVGEVNVNILTNDGVARWPRQGGYSSAGVVESVGAGVKSLKPGDRVAMSWTVHSEYVVVPEENACPVPDGVSFEAAALAHISTFPMAAIRKCRLEVGESAIVMGQGVLGQLAVMLLKCAGAAPVFAADPLPGKRERALELGADFALDPLAPDFAERLRSMTPNPDSAIFKGDMARGVNVAIEVTGRGEALDSVLDAMAVMGRVALLGCTRSSNFTIDYYHKVHGRGVTLIGAHTWARPAHESYPGHFTHRDDVRTFLRLLSLGRISLDGFVDEVHPVADAPEVYRRLGDGGSFPVVEFDWLA